MNHKTFLEEAEEYLKYYHKLGFSMGSKGRKLLHFAKYADKIGHKGHITIDLALQWAKLPQKCNSTYWAHRLDIVRRFAKYMKLTVPKTEIPSKGMLGPSYGRSNPYIYSEEEIVAIIKTARTLIPVNGLRPDTYATLFGLLACTGMRISEALHLSQENLDIHSETVTILETKFHKSRVIPLHHTALEPLKYYINKRDKRHPIPKTKAFFVSECGISLKYFTVLKTFRKIIFKLGWRNKAGNRNPRIHDIRHTFAVRKLLEWYRSGEDVHQKISQLSTYLGHAKIVGTYWYLTATPELMAIAASRFERSTFIKEM